MSLMLSPCAALAQVAPLPPLAPLHFKGQFVFGYEGINFGKAGVDIGQSTKETDMVADIMSTGIVNAFIKHSSHTTMHAKGDVLPYANVNYESHYQTKKKKKYAHMLYEKGVVVEENVQPPDNREKRPVVSKALKDQSSDPLTLIMAMRQKLYDSVQKGDTNYSLYLYDGRRLSQIHFNIIGDTVVKVGKEKRAVVQVDVSRTLVEGYTDSELQDAKQKEPPLHVYFTRDAQLVPILFEAPMWLGSVHAILTRVCAEGESCLLGIKE